MESIGPDSFRSFPVGSTDAVLEWFSKRLNGPPGPKQVYQVGKELYELGLFDQASSALAYYVSMRQSEPVGAHLLGYAYYMSGRHMDAVRELLKHVNEGYETDWQLLVEAQVIAEETYEKIAVANAGAERRKP